MRVPEEAGLRALRGLLDRYPSVRFDLVQYLSSLPYAGHLRSRASLYRRYQNGSSSSRVTVDALFRDLKDRLVEEVPAYAGYRSYAAFTDLPFISKTNLQAEDPPFVARASPGAPAGLWQTATFGTTSAPVAVFYSPEFYFEYLYLSLWKLTGRLVERAGERRDAFVGEGRAVVAEERSAVFALCVDDKPTRPEFATLDPSRLSGLTLRILLDPMDGRSVERVFRIIREVRPAVVATRPSLFEVLMAYAGLHSVSVADAGVRGVFSAGSFLSEDTRREISRAMGAPVVNCYGLAEFGYVAGECEDQCGYHLDETSVLLELLDATGLPVAGEEEGEVVLSSTVNRGMPLLRFRTGDYSVLERAPCRCGLHGPRLRYIKGHGPFHYRLHDGTRLHPARFYPLAWLFHPSDFRVTEDADGVLRVTIEPSLETPADVSDQATALLRRIVPGSARVEVSVGKVTDDEGRGRFTSATPGSMIGRD